MAGQVIVGELTTASAQRRGMQRLKPGDHLVRPGLANRRLVAVHGQRGQNDRGWQPIAERYSEWQGGR